MDSPCLSAAGLRFLDHPVPAEGSAFLAVGSLRSSSRDDACRPRRDFRVPHDGRCDRGGCLLCAGAEVSAAGPMEPRVVRPRRRCRRRVRRPSPPCQPSITVVRYITTLCIEGSVVHPSDLRLARISTMAVVVLGLSSGLHTAPLPARHAGCGDRAGHCSRTHEVTPFMRLTRRTHCLYVAHSWCSVSIRSGPQGSSG